MAKGPIKCCRQSDSLFRDFSHWKRSHTCGSRSEQAKKLCGLIAADSCGRWRFWRRYSNCALISFRALFCLLNSSTFAARLFSPPTYGGEPAQCERNLVMYQLTLHSNKTRESLFVEWSARDCVCVCVCKFEVSVAIWSDNMNIIILKCIHTAKRIVVSIQHLCPCNCTVHALRRAFCAVDLHRKQ